MQARLIEPDKLNEAIFSAAKAGKFKEVNELIAKGASVNSAIAGYAEAGYADKVEALIQQTVHGFYQTAHKGYRQSKQLQDHNHMRILATTNDPALRRTMANLEIGMDPKKERKEIDALLETTATINKYMKTYQFTFAQAEELHNEILRIRNKYQQGFIASFFGDANPEEFGEILKTITRIRQGGLRVVSIPMQEFSM